MRTSLSPPSHGDTQQAERAHGARWCIDACVRLCADIGLVSGRLWIAAEERPARFVLADDRSTQTCLPVAQAATTTEFGVEWRFAAALNLDRRQGSHLRLLCQLAGGEALELGALSCPARELRMHPRPGTDSTSAFALLAKGMHVLRRGGFAALGGRLRHHRSALLPPLRGEHAILRALQRVPGTLELFVDHGLGGGAATVCDARVAAARDAGAGVVRLQALPLWRAYRITLLAEGVDCKATIRNPLTLLDALARRVSRMELHTAAHFDAPEQVFALLALLRARHDIPLVVHIHDFFMVCPSHFLLAADGHFCGVPATERCQQCLPHNRHTALPGYRHYDPAAWRQACGMLLDMAEAVCTPSRASAELLRRAYPWLRNIQHAPPDYRPTHIAPITAEQGDAQPRLRIGVLGAIAQHKGSEVVAALAQFIREQHVSASITVLGHIDARCDGRVLRQTGAYTRDALPGLIRASEINLILFPSIVPETFSFTIREATATGLPVACFNLGAQADWLRGYPKGALLERADAATLYGELETLLMRCRAGTGGDAVAGASGSPQPRR